MSKQLDNPYLLAAVFLLIVVYGKVARTSLPPFVRDLFRNPLFRVMFLSVLLTHTFKKRPSVSLLVAAVFIFVMQQLNCEEVEENFVELQRLKKNEQGW